MVDPALTTDDSRGRRNVYMINY